MSPGPSEIPLATQALRFLTNLQSFSNLFSIAKLSSAFGSHHSIFYYYPSEVLAIAALCRKREYIICIGTDVLKINFHFLTENVLKCHRGNMFV